MGRPSGSGACSATSNGVPSSTQPRISPRNLVSRRFTTKAGASLTSTQFFFSALPTASAVASVASSVRAAGHRTTSTSGIMATGLKKWNPTTRSGCASPDAISVTDSEEVFVASTQSGLTTASTSANTCCLTAISSNTASITKSASANASLVSDPVTSAVSRAASVGADPAALAELGYLGPHMAHPGVEPRLVQVGQHDRHLEPPGEQQRDLRGHQPGADHADLGDRAGQRFVRGAHGLAGPLLGQVEGVKPGPQFVAEQQVGEPVVFGGEPLVAAPAAGRRHQVDGPVGSGRGAVQLAVREEPRPGDGLVPFLRGS